MISKHPILVLSFLLAPAFTSCKSRDFNNKGAVRTQEGPAPVSKPVEACYEGKQASIWNTALEQRDQQWEVTEKYVQSYLEANLMFPQTNFAIRLYALDFLLHDPSFAFDKNLNELVLTDAMTDKVAKGVSNAHESWKVQYSSERKAYRREGTKLISDARLHDLVRGSITQAGPILKLIEQRTRPEGTSTSATAAAHSSETWPTVVNDKDRFCNIVVAVRTMKEVFRTESVRSANELWKSNLVNVEGGLRERLLRMSDMRTKVDTEVTAAMTEAGKAKNIDSAVIDAIWTTVKTFVQ